MTDGNDGATSVNVIGPVPPDPEQLTDESRRLRVRREGAGEKRFPFPVPNGWFVVDESRALAAGELKSFYAFDKDLVLYRTESGEARLIDAYCPHLGAHIGAGGKVDGDGIRCPFHGWRFDGESGRCTDIPYAEKISPKASLRTYPIVERNHMIWAWHHLEGGEPFYDVPYFAEFDDPDWLPYEVLQFEIGTIAQEVQENEIDLQHLVYVHGLPPQIGTEVTLDGTYRRIWNGVFTVENYGLGCTHISVRDAVRAATSLLPIDEESVRMTWWFTAPRSMGDDAAKMLGEGFTKGTTQDFAIWENKRYRPKPLLTANERVIREFRSWARQFYSGLNG